MTMQIKDLIIKTEKVNWQELKDLQPTNLKTPYHSNLTKESLIKNGFAFTFYIWENSGQKYIIDGHLRADILRELKSEGYDIPDQLNCTFLDLPDKKTAIRYLLEVFNTKKNPIDEATMIDWIEEEEVEDLSVDWLDINQQEIEAEEKEAEEDDFAAPDTNQITTDIVKGDIFEFRKENKTLHRLMCGDSTSVDDVEKLMNGETEVSIYTDPPYGINLNGDNSKRGSKSSIMKGGLKLHSFIDDSISYAIDAYNLTRMFNCKKEVWWGANYYCHALPQTNNWLVWDKRVEEKMRNTNSDCELAYVVDGHNSVRIFRHLWNGLIKASEKGERRVHPTQKPTALAQYCFKEYEMEGVILDLFLGSGSTMVASHQLKRKCYGMELDPKYCQVIIDRMKKLDSEIEVIKVN